MKKLRAMGITGILFLAAMPLHAQQPPYLDFVQGLRAKGHPDLALEYMQDNLLKIAPPDLKKELPLEMAKARADMAQLETVPAKREALYAQAREELLAFLKENAKSPRAADANLELARLLSLQGKTFLTRGEREQQPEVGKTEKEKARLLFEDAGKRFDEAASFITAQLGRADLNDKDKHFLTQAKMRTELEQGINLLYLFLAYDDEAGKARADAAKKAREALKKIGDGDDKNSLTWVAQAWLGRYFYETEDFRAAKTTLQKVMDEKSPQADAGRRLAKYDYLLLLNRDAENKNALADKVKLGEQWLKEYPNYLSSPEGLGVRFQLAEAYYEQALKSPTASPAQRKLFDLAEQLFNDLERTENEFTPQARERKMEIVYTRSAGRSKGDIHKLNNFEECYLRAQVEIGQMNKEAKDQKKKPDPKLKAADLEKRRQKHIDDMTLALNRALDLVDDKTPVKDVIETRYLLTFLYLNELKDPYRAALLGEDLVRRAPTADRAGIAAAYALEAYYQIVAADQGKEEPDAKDVEADQRRIRQFAALMEKALPADPATDRARHFLGSFALKENDLPEAIRLFSQITPGYPAYTFTEYQLAIAALQYQEELDKQARDENKPLEEKNRVFRQQALDALKRIPELPAGADAVTTQFYFYGKLDLTKLLFATGQYEHMAALSAHLKERYEGTKDKPGAKAKLEENVCKKIEATLEVLPVYVDYGKADAQYQEAHYDKVRELLDPRVKELMESKLQSTLDGKIIRAILVMDLRANVQDGETERAGEILKLLLKNKSFPNLQATAVILEELGHQFDNQLEVLQKKGSSAQNELAKKAKNFAAFHKQAAELLAEFPPPKAEGDKQVDPKELGFYHYVQILCIREMRLGKQFDAAREKLKKEMTSAWGKNNLELKKELYCLWEDEEKYAVAAKAWNDLLISLQKMEKTEKLRDLYYESYFHLVWSAFKSGQHSKEAAKKKDYIKKAATLLVNLQKSKPLYAKSTLEKLDELRKKEPELDDACKEVEKSLQ
jgi:hypothetical protein